MSATPLTDAKMAELEGESIEVAYTCLMVHAIQLERMLQEHNQGCLAACGKTTTYEHTRESRRCDPRRDCPDCPKDWMIEISK